MQGDLPDAAERYDLGMEKHRASGEVKVRIMRMIPSRSDIGQILASYVPDFGSLVAFVRRHAWYGDDSEYAWMMTRRGRIITKGDLILTRDERIKRMVEDGEWPLPHDALFTPGGVQARRPAPAPQPPPVPAPVAPVAAAPPAPQPPYEPWPTGPSGAGDWGRDAGPPPHPRARDLRDFDRGGDRFDRFDDDRFDRRPLRDLRDRDDDDDRFGPRRPAITAPAAPPARPPSDPIVMRMFDELADTRAQLQDVLERSAREQAAMKAEMKAQMDALMERLRPAAAAAAPAASASGGLSDPTVSSLANIAAAVQTFRTVGSTMGMVDQSELTELQRKHEAERLKLQIESLSQDSKRQIESLNEKLVSLSSQAAAAPAPTAAAAAGAAPSSDDDDEEKEETAQDKLAKRTVQAGPATLVEDENGEIDLMKSLAASAPGLLMFMKAMQDQRTEAIQKQHELLAKTNAEMERQARIVREYADAQERLRQQGIDLTELEQVASDDSAGNNHQQHVHIDASVTSLADTLSPEGAE